MKGQLIQNKIIVDTPNLKSQLIQKGFGEKKDKDLILDLFEGIYLTKKNKVEVVLNNKKVSAKKLLEIAITQDKKFYSKYLVFEDLRNKNYTVKNGLKFGFDFRVYPKGKAPGKAHSKFGINVYSQSDKLTMTKISNLTRLATSIKIEFVSAVVDNENELSYYSTTRNLI